MSRRELMAGAGKLGVTNVMLNAAATKYAYRIAGHSWLQNFTRIAMPLAMPGIAAAGLLAFIFCWNNFVFALILASADKYQTELKERAEAKVVSNQWLGDQTHIAFDVAGKLMVTVAFSEVGAQRGETMRYEIPSGRLHVFDADSGKAISHGSEAA